jgi:glycosyltransferase involved in cell wall biosynthesis
MMKNEKPRVSIGLPVFNAEKYLEQALDSILAQTYTDFELIISDNASTDRTSIICQAYAARDERIRYYRNDKNLGAAQNFNRVFQLSSGEYFKWAAHDDALAPEFLARCVEVLDQNPHVVLCYSWVKIIDENGIFEVDYDPGPDTSSPRPHTRFHNLTLHPEYATQQMGLIRAQALRKTDLHGSYPSSDEVLLAELALLGQFYEIRERLFLYRRYRQQLAQAMDERSRVPFYDMSLRDKIVLPKWLYLFACLKAIKRAPLTWDEKVHCYLTMVRWVLVAPHFRAIGKDVLLAVQKATARVLFGPETASQ